MTYLSWGVGDLTINTYISIISHQPIKSTPYSAHIFDTSMMVHIYLSYHCSKPSCFQSSTFVQCLHGCVYYIPRPRVYRISLLFWCPTFLTSVCPSCHDTPCLVWKYLVDMWILMMLCIDDYVYEKTLLWIHCFKVKCWKSILNHFSR